ncbi:PTS transporter subunit IIC [Anaerorhabdus sp.]|nr:PTS transporter subunit IIC [Anaerorhabdus sp.]MEA4875267.1 PTS transporter subunit IIC [Anaerorhabdus sp.]
MFNDVLQYILGLGAAIFLPVIMIIIGLIVKLKLKKAIIAGLTLGIAFTGMSVILDFMFGAISPVATQFVENTGIALNIIDVGWSPMAAIAWAWPYALLVFPLQIIINLVMLGFNWTNVLNVDLWNVWGKIFTATMVSAFTNNVYLGFLAAAVQVVLELVVGGASQKQIQKETGIPGVTCTHYMLLQALWMNPINKLMDKIPGLNSKSFETDKIKEKLGIFSENSIMGFIVGLLLSLLAGNSIGTSLQVAIKVATALVLFPMVAKLFMQSLAPIADAAGTFMKSKFKDREIFIGLDWPFMAGRSEIWIVSIILVPVELALAFLMAKFGFANVLPLAGIINIIVAVPALVVTNGNLIRMIILGIIFTPVYLFVSSAFAPAATALAQAVGTITIPVGQMITYFGVEAPLFRYFISTGLSGNIVGIVGLLLMACLLIYYIKTMKKKDNEVE